MISEEDKSIMIRGHQKRKAQNKNSEGPAKCLDTIHRFCVTNKWILCTHCHAIHERMRAWHPARITAMDAATMPANQSAKLP